MGILKLESDAKLVFQILLRTAYGSGYIPEFKYDKDREKSLIDIRRDFPKRLLKLPTIVVGASAADTSINELGPNAPRKDILDEEPYIEYRGSSTITVRFSIFAGSSDDRDMITDFTAFCLRFLFRHKAAENGFEYSKITVGSDNQQTLNGELVFTQSITINNCLTEFNYTVPIELVDIINKMNLDNIKIDGENFYE